MSNGGTPVPKDVENIRGVDYSPLYGKYGLIDGDIVAHRAAAIAEKKFYLVTAKDCFSVLETNKEAKELSKGMEGSLIWARTEDRGVELVVEACRTTMRSLLAKTRPENYQVWLSGRENFRFDIAKTRPYKGFREFLEKPKHLKACRDLLILEYDALVSDGCEADDELGIGATDPRQKSFIATIDKDLDQVPGWKFNWVKDSVYNVSPRQADFNFYTQLLTGDRTDDIPGLEGVGPVAAATILDGAASSSDLFGRVWAAYRDRSGKKLEDAWNYMLEQASLVFVSRYKQSTFGYWRPPYIPDEIEAARCANAL